nr:discoidin domain-containing protein [Streptomyces brevispora]
MPEQPADTPLDSDVRSASAVDNAGPGGVSPVSRRRFLATNTTLLAAFGISAALPAPLAAADGKGRPGAAAVELAAARPVKVSSTAYAAAVPEFAVDGIAVPGVRGTGWRAEPGDPQWIAVDLQARCTVESVELVFEAVVSDPPFVPGTGGNPRDGTDGTEILSSCAVAFTLEVSEDERKWTTVHRATDGRGGATTITLDKPATARWVRLTVTERSNDNPLGLNGFRVHGRTSAKRPAAESWTDWSMPRTPAPALAVAADGTVPLESGWALTMDDFAPADDGAVVSGSGVDTADWLPATVPGTVLASLVEQGHLPDPVTGLNNLRVPEALSRHSWWYRRAFRLPRGLDTGRGRRVRLEFDGINDAAQIWLNGTRVGTMSRPFARESFDITDALHEDGRKDNVLAVRISPMPLPGSPADKGPGGESWLDAGATMMMRNGPTYLSVSGWDWMPPVRDRAAGIWNHVRLRSTGTALLGDPQITTELPNLPALDVAEVTLTVPVRNAGSEALRVTVRAAFGDVRVAKTVTVPAGKSVDAVLAPKEFPALRVRRPRLWWPNGYGKPDLYDLTLKAETGGAETDRRGLRFGIREFGYSYGMPVDFVAGHGGQTVEFEARRARYVRLVGTQRATDWGMSLWSLSVYGDADPDKDLARGAKAEASTSDGTGPASNVFDGDRTTRWSSEFADGQWIQADLGSDVSVNRVVLDWETAYAKKFVIQVSADGKEWTDAKSVEQPPVRQLQITVNGTRVFCRGGNWGYDELLRRALDGRTEDTVRMHRDMNFTMIRNWVGSSNREEFFAACDENGLLVWNDFWNGWSMDPPDHADYLRNARDTVRAYRHHASIVVWCGSNEGTPPADIDTGVRELVTAEAPGILYMGSSADGVVKGRGPYNWVDPVSYFRTGDFGFHTEIGMPVLPVEESMKNLVGDEPAWPIGNVWGAHDWARKGNQQPQGYQAAIEERLGMATGLADFTRKAQLINYENGRAMFEAWNTRLWDNASGLLLWMSHPAWHSTVWQTYDYDLDVNGFYHGVRKGTEPVHIQVNPVDWRTGAVNHTTRTIKAATVTATLYDLRGQRLGKPMHSTVDLAPSSAATGDVVAFGDALPALHLLRLELRDAHGTVLSRNTYWRHRATTDLSALNKLARTRVTVRSVSDASGHGRGPGGKLRAVVRNDGATVAAMVRLSLRDRRTDQRVLPAYFDDNYLWLLPGEQREIEAEWSHDTKGRARPRLVVEGYNVSRSVNG